MPLHQQFRSLELEHKQAAESARSSPPSPRVGSFICRESISEYTRGMATMATMATLIETSKKNEEGRRWGGSELTNENLSRDFFRGQPPRVAMVAIVATSQKSRKRGSSLPFGCRHALGDRVAHPSPQRLHGVLVHWTWSGLVLRSWPRWPPWPPLN